MGDQFAQEIDDVGRDTVIPVFLDHNPRRGTLGIDVDQPVLNPAIVDDLFDCLGNIHELLAFTGTYDYRLMHGLEMAGPLQSLLLVFYSNVR